VKPGTASIASAPATISGSIPDDAKSRSTTARGRPRVHASDGPWRREALGWLSDVTAAKR
jgi:hypothetical protein